MKKGFYEIMLGRFVFPQQYLMVCTSYLCTLSNLLIFASIKVMCLCGNITSSMWDLGCFCLNPRGSCQLQKA